MLNLEDARKTLRYKTTAHDDEIQDSMTAAIADLTIAGVRDTPEADALIDQATRLYLRWQFNYCSRGPEYERCYKELKNSLALAFPAKEDDTWTKNSC